MCEISKSQRRAYRDQDPPRITDSDSVLTESLSKDETEFSRKHQEYKQRREEALITAESRDSPVSNGRGNSQTGVASNTAKAEEETVPSSLTIINSSLAAAPTNEVITNGVKRDPDSCESLTNGRDMAPVMGVPPPPPAPHMGPDGLILPRKPYNPCLISNNHKDLRRELLFNQKMGKNVLNQKSELERALERQREAAMRRESERNREETYKDDPRTALQRAIEQRARQLELSEQPPIVEPPNPLVTARAKLRTRTDSQ
ncbi:uncharacterized protein LOC107045736 [Diachasma alloeum]|uniref:uncharacterized protein LOC107045736 n=1 Tax=Diachasma alloeum TaxID=454923 RepID=UPI0007382ECA|nr:uncharacterized protein LOC107045736 [Diachasma alloeum]